MEIDGRTNSIGQFDPIFKILRKKTLTKIMGLGSPWSSGMKTQLTKTQNDHIVLNFFKDALSSYGEKA